MSLTSIGATPSSMPATFTLPSTAIANPPPSSQTLIAPGTTGTLTVSTSATAVMLATGTTASLTLSVNGSAVGPFACTQPAETLTSAPII